MLLIVGCLAIVIPVFVAMLSQLVLLLALLITVSGWWLLLFWFVVCWAIVVQAPFRDKVSYILVTSDFV